MRERFVDSASVCEHSRFRECSRSRQCERTTVNVDTSRSPRMLAASTRVSVKWALGLVLGLNLGLGQLCRKVGTTGRLCSLCMQAHSSH